MLEKQLEVSHPQRVRTTILDPLGMTASSFVVTSAIEPLLATGWMRTYDGRRFEAPTFLLGTGPAGNLYSSVIDLSKFLVCLFNDGKTESRQIVSPAMLKRMTTAGRGRRAANPKDSGLAFKFNHSTLRQRLDTAARSTVSPLNSKHFRSDSLVWQRHPRWTAATESSGDCRSTHCG